MNEEKKSNLPMILGIGCLVLIVVGGAAIGGCVYLSIVMVDKAFDKAGSELLSNVEDEGERSSLQAKFEQVKGLDLPMTQKAYFLSVIGNMINDDQKISGDEIQRLHEILDECIAKGQDVNLQDYVTGEK